MRRPSSRTLMPDESRNVTPARSTTTPVPPTAATAFTIACSNTDAVRRSTSPAASTLTTPVGEGWSVTEKPIGTHSVSGVTRAVCFVVTPTRAARGQTTFVCRRAEQPVTPASQTIGHETNEGPSRRSADEPNELVAAAAAGDVHGEHRPDAACVVLVFEHLRLERGGVLGLQHAVVRARGHLGVLGHREHLGHVLRLATVELLPVAFTDHRLDGHHDPGLGAVDAG